MTPNRRTSAIAALVLSASIGLVAWVVWGRPHVRVRRALGQARAALSAREYREAERLAQAALELDPALADAGFVAAQSAAGLNGFERSLEWLDRIDPRDPRTKFRKALLSARLLDQRLHRLDEAERAYRAALEIEPDDLDANEGLARLLGLCARTREAIPNVLRIIRQEVPTDLLVLVARPDGVLNEPDALDAARKAAPEDANPLIGAAWHAAEGGELDRAVALLHAAIEHEPGHIAAHVALGKALLEARRFDDLVSWAEHLPPGADEFSETWLIRGRIAERDGQQPAAIRCDWEALSRAPESKAAASHLARLLAEVGEAQSSARVAEQVRKLQALEAAQNRTLFSNTGGAQTLLESADSYAGVGRLWEAYGWCQAAVRLEPENAQAQRRLQELRTGVEGLPLRLTADAANPARAVDLSNYPLPQLRSHPSPRPVEGSASAALARLSFRDDAHSAGLRFRYDDGTAGLPAHRMYEFTGGGIGVLDFDLDGWSDVFFTQGCSWPPRSASRARGDRLFKNRAGADFEDVSDSAGLRHAGFGQGAAVGDYNADGFPDLYAAHIGANQLLVNNGDGTFSDRTGAAGVRGKPDDWTTSCLMADLTGDGLPDLYAANYVGGPDVFERICRHLDGSPRICMPFDFDAQPDHLWINDGTGGFVEAGPESLEVAEGGKGLGVAAWNADGTGRLALLVANDTTPNFFFVAEAGSGTWRLRDRGIESGLAVDGEGKAKGCMGIALGDLNGDGLLDLHVTNFLNEASTLYLSGPGGSYEDRTRESGLYARTLDLLGFGTQFLDADLDGRLELFMASGHIDDFRKQGKPYRMPAKLFRWGSGRFLDVNADELGPYFGADWLGRAVARLDWNRDGLDDLVVGHLHDDSALLTNTTGGAGRFLSVRLFGVQSNRDAIGATVEVRLGERKAVHQLTAGDGYQASNERRLSFGLGEAAQVDEVTVRWPAGTTQRFPNVPASSELWLVEGRAPVVRSR